MVGILDDKPYERMLAELLPCASRVVITRPGIGRALPPQALVQAARKYPADIRVADTVEAAVTEALTSAGGNEAVCIAGSLYVVGEAKEAFEKHPGLLARQAAGA